MEAGASLAISMGDFRSHRVEALKGTASRPTAKAHTLAIIPGPHRPPSQANTILGGKLNPKYHYGLIYMYMYSISFRNNSFRFAFTLP